MEKLIYKQEKFFHTLDALERSIKVFSRTDIDHDIRENLIASVIKHFEMCYEASWKFLKFYLEIGYAEVVDSPKKVFRQCFAMGIIDESTTKELLDISEARNATTHDYDQENAHEICQRIGDYYITFKKLRHPPLRWNPIFCLAEQIGFAPAHKKACQSLKIAISCAIFAWYF